MESSELKNNLPEEWCVFCKGESEYKRLQKVIDYLLNAYSLPITSDKEVSVPVENHIWLHMNLRVSSQHDIIIVSKLMYVSQYGTSGLIASTLDGARSNLEKLNHLHINKVLGAH